MQKKYTIALATIGIGLIFPVLLPFGIGMFVLFIVYDTYHAVFGLLLMALSSLYTPLSGEKKDQE